MAMTNYHNPLLNLTIKRMEGRHITDKKDHHLIDFSTQGYLGFDTHPAITEAQISGLKTYGNVVPWSRTVAVFDIFTEVEARLAKLLRMQAANLFLSTTLLNHGVIPALAGSCDALIAFEKFSHVSSFEGALLAKEKCATLRIWQDLDVLEEILKKSRHKTKLIVTDGVNAMSGAYANVPALTHFAKQYKATLYLDDAHGFGVVGEHPSDTDPYGKYGNGVAQYYGCDDENILYVGCFSKAYGLPGAFIGCSKSMKDFLLRHATPHDLGFSGQASVMMGLLKAMELNEKEGESVRRTLFKHTLFLQEKLLALGFSLYHKTTPFPIITVALGGNDIFLKACRTLYAQGILVTVEPATATNSHHLLRITLTHGLSLRDVQSLVQAFQKIRDFVS